MSASARSRVLAIMGSPRRHGNSEALLNAFIEGVSEAGGTADRLIVVEEDIKVCLGCNACSMTGECVQVDAMNDIYPRIDAADALAVASPVFFASVPGTLKTFFDRFQPYWARRYELKRPAPESRPGAVLLVRGGGGHFEFEGALFPCRSVFGVLGVRILDEITVTGPDSPGDLRRYPEAIERAKMLGRRVVEEARE